MPERKGSRSGEAAVRGFFQVFGILVDKVGFAGGILLFVLWFISTNATRDQKHRIIEMYVLGQGITLIWPTLVVVIFCMLVVTSQHFIYRKKEDVLQNRIDELAREKGALLEESIGRRLRHAADVPAAPPRAHRPAEDQKAKTKKDATVSKKGKN